MNQNYTKIGKRKRETVRENVGAISLTLPLAFVLAYFISLFNVFLICLCMYLSHKRPLPYITVYVVYLCVELLLQCILFCHA